MNGEWDGEAVADHERRLDEHDGEISDLRGRLEQQQHDTEISDLQGDVERLEQQQRDGAASVSRVSKKLPALGRRIDRLERQARTAGNPAPAGGGCYEFDEHAAWLARLAAARERALDVQEGLLLPKPGRRVLEQTVGQHSKLCAGRDRNRTAALDGSAAVTSTGMGSEEHIRAAGEYRAALAAYQEAKRTIVARQPGADDARERIRIDDARRQEHAAVLRAGREAHDTLCRELREHVVTMVQQHAEPPRWFSIALGEVPPAEQPHKWVDLARDVLMYRCAYGVRDEVDALGSPPGADASPRRQAVYEELRSKLRAYH